MPKFLFLFLTLFLAHSTWADDPTPIIPVPDPVIHAIPVQGRILAIGQSQKISYGEFEIFSLSGLNLTSVTWDANSPDSEDVPITWFEAEPKTPVIGYRASHPKPGKFYTPDSPSVVVYASGTGKASLTAWGVRDGKPYKVATLLIEANLGPQPPPKPKPDPNVEPNVNPNPKPNPNPNPTPQPPVPITSKVLTVVVIEKAIERTPETAAIIANLAYWKSLEPTVETVHIVPAGTPIADLYKKQVAAGGGKLPVIILMDHETKKILFSGPLPTDIVGVSALINKYITK